MGEKKNVRINFHNLRYMVLLIKLRCQNPQPFRCVCCSEQDKIRVFTVTNVQVSVSPPSPVYKKVAKKAIFTHDTFYTLDELLLLLLFSIQMLWKQVFLHLLKVLQSNRQWNRCKSVERNRKQKFWLFSFGFIWNYFIETTLFSKHKRMEHVP